MAKKKTVPSSTASPHKPLFIRLKGAELDAAIRNDDDNFYAGPEHPHPNHGGYGTTKHIDIVWYQTSLDALLQQTAPLLRPSDPNSKRNLLKHFVKNDGYANDPVYGLNVARASQVKFWKRDIRGERERGLNPPNYPQGGLPGVDY